MAGKDSGWLDRVLLRWRRRNWRPGPAATRDAALLPFVAVTGGSEGIGLAMATEFARRGHPVLLIARRQAPLAAAAAALRLAHGGPVIAVSVDVTATGAEARIRQAAAAAGGFVDVLVNNAGIGLSGPFLSHSSADLDRLCALNMIAVTQLMRALLQEMVERGRGGVLTVGSLAGLMPGPNQAAYYASKAYVISLVEAVAYETRGQGVRVSVVVPGAVDTGFHRAMGAEQSPYLKVLPVMAPAKVALSAYFWFRLGRVLIVPGFIHHVTVVALRFMPHSVILPLMSMLLHRPDSANAGRPEGPFH